MSISKNGIVGATNNPNNVVVSTSERFISGPTGRIVSRKTLLNRVRSKCDVYKAGKCKDCETAKEIPCIEAWKLTIGTGKKLY
ncbi:hypothetical protein YDYSY3_38220 [Paenibacillus chitinolyticus]|uniref:hypothetical protein n=1 Tax=Paenibacillus chitinolyticus TaxID=79263 RepID=UPI0026E4C1F3|nr:hypothetical protein [Paenibacillus chitinolyticus]GKS12822.1 hypothetical protein YDYSY3_38220 [Paenibacillus chitinolyticus]